MIKNGKDPHSFHYHEMMLGDEVFIAIPLLNADEDFDVHDNNNEIKNQNAFHPYKRPITTYITITFQTLCYIFMIVHYGVAPIRSNPLIGIPMEDLDHSGSKNILFILKEGQYWRIFSSMFLYVGFLDLFCSNVILLLLGSHVEVRWGALKCATVYLISGIFGNIYSLIDTPYVISVGNGASILGLLGVLNVETLHQMFSNIKKRDSKKLQSRPLPQDATHLNDDKEHCNDFIFSIRFQGMIFMSFIAILAIIYCRCFFPDNLILAMSAWSLLYLCLVYGFVSSSQVTTHDITRKEDEVEINHLERSMLFIIGLSFGALIISICRILFPDNPFFSKKDWSVLFGGYFCGVLLGMFYTTLCYVEQANRVFAGICMICIFVPIITNFLWSTRNSDLDNVWNENEEELCEVMKSIYTGYSCVR